MQHTPVLIIGGSLVGLSASLFLAWRGVPHILVEKHTGSSPHPRAMGFTETTMEHYRAVGIADRIPQAPRGTRLRRVKVASLSSDWISESDWTPGQSVDRSHDLSPCTGAAIAQDKLEPILCNAAQEMGADLRYGVELLNFEHRADKVTAQLRNRESGIDYDITADFLIAADGAASGIREALGIARNGVGHLKTLHSVLFSCPEADQFLARGAQQFEIEQDGFRAFLTTYGDSRWVLMLSDGKERSREDLAAAVRRALGSDMPFDILTTGQWEMAGRIADRYSEGRVFLAGDAAHQLPPTRGGFGANTGIDDVWNLAWKLERVVSRASPVSLLDTYSVERQPIGFLRHQQTFSRPDYAQWVGDAFTPDLLFSNDAMEFGQLVRSSQVIAAPSELPAAASPDEWKGQPGTRAPHVWIIKSEVRVSTLDLFGREFVFLTANRAWRAGVKRFDLKIVEVNADVHFLPESSFGDVFGVGAEGATLIRPDGIVAWRTTSIVNDGDLQELHRIVGTMR
jgi:2-polyprenyl-6-methoxyphenol hydroxylase-like FAD-dependent oxidoreductase